MSRLPGGAAVKALTVKQPWATAIMFGLKQYETRSWRTPYRGRIAIHTSRRQPTREDMSVFGFDLRRRLPASFPRGVVLGTCVLEDVILCTRRWTESLSWEERLLGNFTFGRYAWRLADVQPFDEPEPADGHLGLWEWR